MSAVEKATPRPWRVVAGDDYMVVSDATPAQYPHRCRGDDLGRFVALVGNRGADLGEHDAALIVEAVNSFEALIAERDALKAENEHIRERDIGLIEELIDALTELHEAADCNDLKRSARINELRRDLDMSR